MYGAKIFCSAYQFNFYFAFSFSFDRTGTIAFSGQIWAQSAQPVQRSALM
jgi:hypothetical protein